jgi:hypothetical protein
MYVFMRKWSTFCCTSVYAVHKNQNQFSFSHTHAKHPRRRISSPMTCPYAEYFFCVCDSGQIYTLHRISDNLIIIDVRYQLSTVFSTSLLLENRWNHDNGVKYYENGSNAEVPGRWHVLMLNFLIFCVCDSGQIYTFQRIDAKNPGWGC